MDKNGTQEANLRIHRKSSIANLASTEPILIPFLSTLAPISWRFQERGLCSQKEQHKPGIFVTVNNSRLLVRPSGLDLSRLDCIQSAILSARANPTGKSIFFGAERRTRCPSQDESEKPFHHKVGSTCISIRRLAAAPSANVVSHHAMPTSLQLSQQCIPFRFTISGPTKCLHETCLGKTLGLGFLRNEVL